MTSCLMGCLECLEPPPDPRDAEMIARLRLLERRASSIRELRSRTPSPAKGRAPEPKRPSTDGVKRSVMRLVAAFRVGGAEFEPERVRRRMFSGSLKELLRPHLPLRMQLQSWTLLFSSADDGGLSSLYSRASQASDTAVLLVMDSNRHVFGAFTTAPWELQPRLKYFGSAEAFVFTVLPEFRVYKATRTNDHYQLAARDSLAIGGGGGFAIWLDSDLEHGVSHESCTFGNPPLGSSEDFEILGVELWGFTRSASASDLL
jgi:hypothetical protein